MCDVSSALEIRRKDWSIINLILYKVICPSSSRHTTLLIETYHRIPTTLSCITTEVMSMFLAGMEEVNAARPHPASDWCHPL